jgi:hypothetical protein
MMVLCALVYLLQYYQAGLTAQRYAMWQASQLSEQYGKLIFLQSLIHRAVHME